MHALVLLAFFADTEAVSKVEATKYGPFFESNMSGLKGESSHLVFTDAKKFANVLRLVPPIGGRRPMALPGDAFEKSLVLVAIRRGDSPFDYTVEKAEASGGKLVLHYTAKAGKAGGGTARFASPLVVAVPKGKYKAVEFIENGKPAATVKAE